MRGGGDGRKGARGRESEREREREGGKGDKGTNSRQQKKWNESEILWRRVVSKERQN